MSEISNYDEYNKVFYRRNKNTFKNDINTLKSHTNEYFSEFKENLKRGSYYKETLLKRLPIIDWLFLNYKFKEWILSDITSGITVGIVNISQGMAYAFLASLPAINGLYISFFPVIIYALFGTSPHISIGSHAVVGLMTGDVLDDLSVEHRKYLIDKNITLNKSEIEILVTEYKVAASTSLALYVGILQIAMGIFGLGIVTRYFSDTFISSYMCGNALHVLVSQIKDLFGLTNTMRFTGILKVPYQFIDVLEKLPNTNPGTIVTSVICIIYLVIFKELINPRIKKRLKIEFPSELLLVIIMTAVSYFIKANVKYNIDTLEYIPSGLKEPVIPDIKIWTKFITDGIAIALIAFAINISLATMFARKNKYNIDSNQELFAYGISNTVSSFFLCFPNAASIARSSVQEESGAKTQLAAIFSSLIILVIILWFGKYFEALPVACLASLVVVSLKGLLLQIKQLPKLWLINKYEAILWLGTFLSTVILDVDLGLFIGLGLSAFLILIKDQRFEIITLNQYNDTGVFVDENLFKVEKASPENVKIFKIQRALYYVNALLFKEKLFAYYKSEKNQEKVIEENFENSLSNVDNIEAELKWRYLILDFSAVNYIDTTAMKTLVEMMEDFLKLHVQIYICQSQATFIETINNMDVVETFEAFMFVSIADALSKILSLTDSNQD